MGNGTSSASRTSSDTPNSDMLSTYSLGSVRQQDVIQSSGAHSPLEPPTPDLSNLTDEEIAQITAVINRAKDMQSAEENRVRELEEDYLEFAHEIVRKRSLVDSELQTGKMCPICHAVPITTDEDDQSDQHDCVDCEKIICKNCSEKFTVLGSKREDWVCLLCAKRRRLVQSSGMWYHGYHPANLPPPAVDELHEAAIVEPSVRCDKIGSVVRIPASIDDDCLLIKSRPTPLLLRQKSLPARFVESPVHPGVLETLKESGKSFDTSQESLVAPSSDTGRKQLPASRLRAIPPATNSDDDSDIDMDDASSQRMRGDGSSVTLDEASDEFSMMSLGSSFTEEMDESRNEKKRPRPRYLDLSRSQSSASEEDEDSIENIGRMPLLDEAELPGVIQEVSEHSSPSENGGSITSSMIESKESASIERDGPSGDDGRSAAAAECRAICSPSPPASPSWKDALESPPFSPRRRGSYPNRRRSLSPPTSPREKRGHQLAYGDNSPTSKMPWLDESFGDMAVSGETSGGFSLIRSGPMSSGDLSDMTSSGDSLESGDNNFESESRHHDTLANRPNFINGDFSQVVDLASYAATIASNTANLTLLSVSPTNVQTTNTGNILSPDSQDSMSGSTSPISPLSYDEGGDIELADPSSKTIDGQGTKRQKARPPACDWSPVVDLSPIIDVSPSVEEAEQEKMLAEQKALQGSNSGVDDSSDDYEDTFVLCVAKPVENCEELRDGPIEIDGFKLGPLKRYQNLEDISQIDNGKFLHTKTKDLEITKLNSEALEKLTVESDVNDDLAIENDLNSDINLCFTSNIDTLTRDALSYSQCDIGLRDAFVVTTRDMDIIYEQDETGSPDAVIKPNGAVLSVEREIRQISKAVSEAFSCTLSPGRVRRKLPEPRSDAAAVTKKATPEHTGALSSWLSSTLARVSPFHGAPSNVAVTTHLEQQAACASVSTDHSTETAHGADTVKAQSINKANEGISAGTIVNYKVGESRFIPEDVMPTRKYDANTHTADSSEVNKHDEKPKARDFKAKPDPLVLQHIECEEQSVSPQYRVMDSPVTPDRNTKRNYSEDKALTPTSSPSPSLHVYPSPVTPPGPNASPPKPQSPSSAECNEIALPSNGPTSISKPSDQNLGVTANLPSSSKVQADGVASKKNPKPIKVLPKSPTRRPNKDPPKVPVISNIHPTTSDVPAAMTPATSHPEPKDKKIRRKLPPLPHDKSPPVPPPKPKSKPRPPVPPPKPIRRLSQDKLNNNSHGNHGNNGGSIHSLTHTIVPTMSPSSRSMITTTLTTSTLSMTTAAVTTQSLTPDQDVNADDREVANITKDAGTIIGFSEKFCVATAIKCQERRRRSSSDRENGEYAGASRQLGVDLPLVAKVALERDIDILLREYDNDTLIDSLENIYGEPISMAMKSLKKRIMDELRAATERRRRQLEEIEDIRTLEIQIEKLKTAKSHLSAFKAPPPVPMAKPVRKSTTGQITDSPRKTASAGNSPLSSPQFQSKRTKHRRQVSDPSVSKFSPIREDKDIESMLQLNPENRALQTQLSLEMQELARNAQLTDDSSGLSDNETAMSDAFSARYRKIPPSSYAKMFFANKARSVDVLPTPRPKGDNSRVPQLHSSQSDNYIIKSANLRSGTPTFSSDEEEGKDRRIYRLQVEIEHRKQKLDQSSSLQPDIRKINQPVRRLAHSHDDIPRKRDRTPSRDIPTGIIRPIDDDSRETLFTKTEYAAYREGQARRQTNHSPHCYSSTEYLAHKQVEIEMRYSDDRFQGYGYPDDGYVSLEYGQVVKDTEARFKNADPGVTASATLPDLYSFRQQTDPLSTSRNGSPASDYTPAMPLLQDVTVRSRKIIHNISSRPNSAEFNFSGGAEDLLNAMYRAESDNSVDADEPIMKHLTEGGVTILKQLDRKKQPPPQDQRSYLYETKRILLTRDPRDRGSRGNGIGMKIVGGKQLSKSGEMVAYVQTIYPGGVADQLHGELREGDQIVEWNGVCLNGRTFEEVQQIISHPNGEIELLIRPFVILFATRGTNIRPISRHHASKHETDRGSCQSPYDNVSDTRNPDPDDVDRHFAEAATAARVKTSSPRQTKEVSTSSLRSKGHSPEPSNSRSRPSPQKTHTLQSSPAQQRKQSSKTENKSPAGDAGLGEIKLQLKFDDSENTLIVQLIEARNLIPKDINGLSDPFVKVYLLPGRCPEHKRRTKYVSRTLNPQWNETFVFQNIYEEELIRKTIEFTLWDYDRFKTNDFLGAVVLELSNENYWDDKPHWYTVTRNLSASSADMASSDISSQDELAQATSFDSIQSEKATRFEQCAISQQDDNLSHGRSMGSLGDKDKRTRTTQLSSAKSGPVSRYPRETRPSFVDHF